MIKRSYEVTINMQTGDPIKLTGSVAENFWVMWQNYKRGNDIPVGFDIPTATTDGKSFTVKSILFKNVVSVERGAVSETKVDAAIPDPIQECTPEADPVIEVKTFTSEAERRAYLKSKDNVEDLEPKDPSKDDSNQEGQDPTDETNQGSENQ
ncbi:hypothetical protein [uncultured Dubosiella sp.]|uniref:hypothetical protein n=1 Tax=uncultured Dubosiella sp. TaxID=1937011 RepID=UPI0026202667|nr:hypothetical protein [uncultured Dubosiella sp.]